VTNHDISDNGTFRKNGSEDVLNPIILTKSLFIADKNKLGRRDVYNLKQINVEGFLDLFDVKTHPTIDQLISGHFLDIAVGHKANTGIVELGVLDLFDEFHTSIDAPFYFSIKSRRDWARCWQSVILPDLYNQLFSVISTVWRNAKVSYAFAISVCTSFA